ncbi:MAG: phospho-sugar mutase [Flavobacteriaceae bacterium]|jgi:phosphoglucomutase|nr:phospho-sugar mutase [Flavobacteriaceae bacterium]MBT3794788.1 phospho-sugar mutase [Flavobacteriaceae bacterium]MBT5596538.1 phospho-sugar mutase [Flavobacteriaceae bacterium]MBT5857318.1 phospho-sugar mutase [Flavobacteriaceae bacterium]MBT7010840.1 phospho-sugar mutase [Flavobacteriaceae bacterium]
MINTKLIEQNYNVWTQSPFDKETISKVNSLKETNNKDFNDSFYTDLSFGTGGMRGVVGVGPNRVNKYTFGKNTQGISNYINKYSENNLSSIVIAYDCRNDSEYLATQVANIFSSNNIKVFLFSSIRPTPELSYALVKLNCICGIVLTASHNPPEYNGYKVYWKDGGQIVPPIDKNLINEINTTSYSDINFTKNEKLIELIDTNIDDLFIKDSILNGKVGTSNRANYRIVFTPLHGTSYKILPQVLKGAGYTDLNIVTEQAVPDGNFPTVKSPNPEDPEALKIAIELAKLKGADIVIGTDPDSDRVGIAIKDDKNQYIIVNGNQMMIMLTDYLLSKRKQLDKSYFIGSTIVSTQMMFNVAKSYNVDIKLGLTGFKWIAKMIHDFPNQKFIGGGEESYGYMVGDFVRDKDAITSSLLACEAGSEFKSKGLSLYDYLINCYIKYGFFKEKLISIEKKGSEGIVEINSIMNQLRTKKIAELAGSKVLKIQDFKSSQEINQISGEKTSLNFPKSNVLIFESKDGTRVAARPSGTEPKIKFYFSVNMTLQSKELFNETNNILEKKIEKLSEEFNF